MMNSGQIRSETFGKQVFTGAVVNGVWRPRYRSQKPHHDHGGVFVV